MNIFGFLLQQGAPAEMIERLMAQMSRTTTPNKFDTRSVGMKGIPSGFNPVASQPPDLSRR